MEVKRQDSQLSFWMERSQWKYDTATPRIICRNQLTFAYRCQPNLQFCGLTHQAMLIPLIPKLFKGWAMHLVTVEPFFRNGLLRILNVFKNRVHTKKVYDRFQQQNPALGSFKSLHPKWSKTFWLIRRTILERAYFCLQLLWAAAYSNSVRRQDTFIRKVTLIKGGV